jgi:hypothetical protein
MNITFTLTSGSSSTAAGPFNISGTTDANVVSSLATGVTKNQLLTGHTINGINDAITGGTVNSTGTCTTSAPWYVGTPPSTSVLLDNDFILGNTETSTCPGTGTPFGVYISQFDYDNRYSQSAIKFITLYQDDSLTTLYTGYSFVYVIGDTGEIQEVYQLNTSTGQIGNPSGAQPC